MNKNAPDSMNLILALILSVIVIVGWQYFIIGPQTEAQRQHALAERAAEQSRQAQNPTTPNMPSVPGQTPAAAAPQKPEAILAGDSARVKLDSAAVDGSIRLTGARFDDLRLKVYREDVDPKSPEVVFLIPEGAETATYSEIGWTTGGKSNIALPTTTTVWHAVDGQVLTPDTPVTLTWDNGQGLNFTRTISLDKDYMFTIKDVVENKSAAPVSLYPYASVARRGEPTHKTNWILHEGLVGVWDGSLKEETYSDIVDKKEVKFESQGGWAGITDKYWMAAIIPPQNEKVEARYSSVSEGGVNVFRTDYLMGPRSIAPGATTEVTHRFFAGAKVLSLLNAYEDKQGIKLFDKAVDWGWFEPLTRPIFWLLDRFYQLVGNFGIAILMLTVVIKGIMFPLANRSFESMTKMKKVQPQMKELQERYKDDKVKLQQELMGLYKREKINPMMGCLPIFVQIPVFFSLYKVLFVTIEMRHAPFFGWIHDLASADPSNLFTLFGLLPFVVPTWLHIGIWPLLMGATMWLQMRLNPPATDPVQQQMMTYMPFLFTYMMASFPAGLVIYWTWNNILSITQQYIIMRRMNVPVQLNLKVPAWITARLRGPSSTPVPPAE